MGLLPLPSDPLARQKENRNQINAVEHKRTTTMSTQTKILAKHDTAGLAYVTRKTEEKIGDKTTKTLEFIGGHKRGDEVVLPFGLEVKKDYGAGIKLEIFRNTGKRQMSQSVEIGKDDIQRLINFLQEQVGNCRNYNYYSYESFDGIKSEQK